MHGQVYQIFMWIWTYPVQTIIRCKYDYELFIPQNTINTRILQTEEIIFSGTVEELNSTPVSMQGDNTPVSTQSDDTPMTRSKKRKHEKDPIHDFLSKAADALTQTGANDDNIEIF